MRENVCVVQAQGEDKKVHVERCGGRVSEPSADGVDKKVCSSSGVTHTYFMENKGESDRTLRFLKFLEKEAKE